MKTVLFMLSISIVVCTSKVISTIHACADTMKWLSIVFITYTVCTLTNNVYVLDSIVNLYHIQFLPSKLKTININRVDKLK